MRVAYTPGHASHHVCYLHEESGTAFVGDVAAVRIPGVDLIVPPTPPPDIDVEAWEDSIGDRRRLAARAPRPHPLRRDRGPGRRTWPRSASACARRPQLARELAEAAYEQRHRERVAAARLERGGRGRADPVRPARVPVARPRPLLAQARQREAAASSQRRPPVPQASKCSRIRSTASVMRSSGVVRAMRKKPSPLGPYIEPGRDDDRRLFEHQLGEGGRGVALGHRRPDVDRPLRRASPRRRSRAGRRDDQVAAAGVGLVHPLQRPARALAAPRRRPSAPPRTGRSRRWSSAASRSAPPRRCRGSRRSASRSC